MTARGRQFQAVRESAARWGRKPVPREGIPAFAGMTWVGAGYGVRGCGNDMGGCGIWCGIWCGRVRDMVWEGAGYDVGGCGSSRARARVFVVVRRTLSHCVDFCRRREGAVSSGVWTQGEIPAFAGMTWAGAGMTGVEPRQRTDANCAVNRSVNSPSRSTTSRMYRSHSLERPEMSTRM